MKALKTLVNEKDIEISSLKEELSNYMKQNKII